MPGSGNGASFGELLRRHRMEANLTQQALATRSGLTVQAVGMLERRTRRWPRRDTVGRLSRALRLSPTQAEAFVAASAAGHASSPAFDQGGPPGRDGAAAAAMRTLPRDLAAFTGREGELDQLVATVAEMRRSGNVVAITAIDGMAGVGKTAFAIHAAHRLAPEFPDGQLYLNLHAHTAGQRPVTPSDALAALLLTTGVRPQDIPHDVDGRSAMWRDRVASTRTLVLLDDAAGHAQVRPLLPGAEGCLVLITSRRRLAALENVESLTLGTLPSGEAAELFARLIGARARDADRAAFVELVELCGHLPLAIGLLAGRLRSHPAWTVRHLTDTLRTTHDRLAELTAENVAVEAVFNMSYQDLPADQRCLFRRLGLHPGRDIDAHAAAALDGGGPAQARRRLEALYIDHLIDEPLPGRYRLHDLIRAYARSLANQDEATVNDDALDRLLDHYTHTASVASQQVVQRGAVTSLPVAHVSAETPDLSTRRLALEWLESERANLTACLDHAATHARHAHCVRLARAMHSFLCVAGPWDQAVAIHQTALAAARLTGDRPGQASALRDLAVVQRLTNGYAAAIASLTEALTLFRDIGDRAGQAAALDDLGHVQRLSGEYAAASGSLAEALRTYRELGDRLGEAKVLHSLGRVQYLMDQYQAATASLTEALAVQRHLGHRLGQADALLALGLVQDSSGDQRSAAASLTRALGLFREIDYRLGQANALTHLGRVRYQAGDCAAATPLLTEALTMFRDLGDRLGQANAICLVGVVQRLSHEYPAAEASLTQALSTYRGVGHRLGEANTLQELARVQHLMGGLAGATRSLTEARAIYTDLGHRLGQAETLNNLGAVLLDASRPDDALAHHRRALRLAGEIRSPVEEARALEGTGRCLLRGPDAAGGIAHLRKARAIYRRLRVPDAERVGAVLASLDGSAGTTGDQRGAENGRAR